VKEIPNLFWAFPIIRGLRNLVGNLIMQRGRRRGGATVFLFEC
jgi:hypothetical protein